MNNTTTGVDPIEAKIKGYIATTSMADFEGSVTADTDLFEEGFIDSYGFIELVKFLEKEFLISFSESDLLASRLNSLNNITVMVQSKLDGI